MVALNSLFVLISVSPCDFVPPPLPIEKVCMLLGKYEQRAVYKRYNVVGNGLIVYLKLRVRFLVVISNYNRVVYGRDEPYSVCTHWACASDRHHKISKRCSFECDMGKYSTRSMNKVWALRRTPYSLSECCIFTYRTKNEHRLYFLTR